MIGYPDGNARLSRTIVSFLPKQGRTYVEPFCGRGNLLRRTSKRVGDEHGEENIA